MYEKLYEDGICIVEDWFDDPKEDEERESNYPKPLFSCNMAQATYITRTGVSRDFIFDGVLRSQNSCGYDTFLEEKSKKNVPKVGLQ